MQNLIHEILNFISYLEQIELIELNEDKICKEVMELPQFYLEKQSDFINKHKNISINNRYNCVFNISRLSACWNYANDKNEFIYGGFMFNGLSEALAQDSDFWDVYNSLNRYDPIREELDFLKKLNWFEKQTWGDDGKFGCFLREPGDFPSPIYFYDSGAYFPIRLSLEEYFEAMISSCAVRGWQYFYIDFPEQFPELKEVNKAKVLAELERTVTVLPALFPERDFSAHQKRFAEIKEKLK